MKQIYALLFTAASLFSFAQNEKCGTMPNHYNLLDKSEAYRKSFSDAERMAQEWMKNHPNQANAKTQTTITIPVVFHCIYKNTSDVTYIADSTFARQIAIMNETYSLSNPNYANTRHIFDTMGANIDLQFCFASVDPQGNWTSGIDRHQSSANWLTTVLNNSIKSSYPAWDPQHYLNIWTCDMSLFGTPLVLGYASFPGDPDSLSGVVLQSEFVGYQNNGTVNNLGRTMVHEVGHWLGMRHIWGDGQQATNPCDSTDYVEDTPRANNASQTDCDTTKNTCSNEDPFWSNLAIDPPDMVENYMDYSQDACMTMFTKGQKARMWSFINTYRTGLLSNPVGCGSVGINDINNHLSDYVYVYPNPANELVNINLNQVNLNDLKAEIFDGSGKLVKSIKFNSYQNQVNVQDMAKGVYFIKISNSSSIAIKKLILN